jgi:Asp-tRNA(Asn)/Glu-tRNA(Gln) amidotransferase A subunit family amidase
VPVAHEVEGILTLQLLVARLEVDRRVVGLEARVVVEVAPVDVDPNAAELLDHQLEAAEVDRDQVVDLEPGETFDGLDHPLLLAIQVGRVDGPHDVAPPRAPHLDPEVAREGQHRDRLAAVGRIGAQEHDGVRPRLFRALDAYRSLGAEVRDVSLPRTDLAIPVYYIIAPAEASSNLARFDGVRYGLRVTGEGLRGMYEATRSQGFGPEVTRRILLGTYVLSAGYYEAYYRKAQQVRTLIAEDFRGVFSSGVDILFTPTTPTPAFPIGAKAADPYEMYLSDIFTVTANLTGVPAMSVPIGRVDRLPVGGQLMAPHFHEAEMFAAAYALERALGEEAHR